VMAGVEDGYGDAAAQALLLARLQQLQPRLIFVGLGVPRQEFWIQEHRALCPRPPGWGWGAALIFGQTASPVRPKCCAIIIWSGPIACTRNLGAGGGCWRCPTLPGRQCGEN